MPVQPRWRLMILRREVFQAPRAQSACDPSALSASQAGERQASSCASSGKPTPQSPGQVGSRWEPPSSLQWWPPLQGVLGGSSLRRDLDVHSISSRSRGCCHFGQLPLSRPCSNRAAGGGASKDGQSCTVDAPTIAKLEAELAASEAAAGASSYAAADASLGLAIAHFRQGRLEDVERCSQRILAILRDRRAAPGSMHDGEGWRNQVVVCECFLNLALAYVQAERAPEGLEWARNAREVAAEGGGPAVDGRGFLLAMAETVAGMALTAQGQFAGAAAAAEAALRVFEGTLPPGHEYVHQAKYNVASVYAKLGRVGEAMELLGDVVAGAPGGGPLRWQALRRLMPLAVEAGDKEKARLCFGELRDEGLFDKAEEGPDSDSDAVAK